MTTNNSINAPTPFAVGKGGLGITTTPSNGQIPIGNGTDYTAATITAGSGITVTNGSGTISIAASGIAGSWDYISTGTASSSASIVFSSLSNSYIAYCVLLNAIVPATTNTNLYLTYNSISSNYQYAVIVNNAGSGNTQNTSASEIIMNGTGSEQGIDAGNGGLNAQLFLVNPDVSAITWCTWNGGYALESTGNVNQFSGGGFNTSTSAVTEITFEMSSGNISTGTFILYGLST